MGKRCQIQKRSREESSGYVDQPKPGKSPTIKKLNAVMGKIVWAPQEGPQYLAMTCPVEDLLFGGARGGGKSDFLLGDWIAHASRSNGYASGIIFRRTTPQLEQLIKRSKQIYPLLGAKWMAGIKTWIFPCGSTLKMRWLEREEDADNYQGHEYTWIGVDEAGTWPSPAPIDLLRATLRSPHGVKCVIRLTANPGGLGHQWIKDRYVTPVEPKTPFYDKEKHVWRVYIPSRLTDNKKLIESDPTYINRIMSSGPAWLVRAWLNGDWDASANDNYFDEKALKINGKPLVKTDIRGRDQGDWCDVVYATVDTAMKDGAEHDGSAVVYWLKKAASPYKLVLLDWDIIKIQAASLDEWMPKITQRLEYFAKEWNARKGSAGGFIEDKVSGIVLNQQMKKRGMNFTPIPSEMTAMGKSGRCMAVSNSVYSNLVKISEEAYNKTLTYNGETKNHLLSQVCSFVIGQKDGARDLLDCFCYGIQIALANTKGI
jgi:hypothetical protein